MLGFVPGCADAAVRPSPGQRIERGDDFAKVNGVAIGDAGDEGTKADGGGEARQVCESGVTLRHVFPSAPDLWDLAEVIHHPQVAEAGTLGSSGDRRKLWCSFTALAWPVEAADDEPEGVAGVHGCPG